MIRFLDILFSLIGILMLSPLLFVMSAWIVVDNGFPIFYAQSRVGKDGRLFRLYKFRTMHNGADKASQLTVGADRRITRVGAILRKYKMDELPQLFNVLLGEMSLVGPRPEVQRYVNLYSEEQRKVLTIKPGVTDQASITFINESELLGTADDPEKTYIESIMPAKLELNMPYINNRNVSTYLRTICRTLLKIVT